MCLRSVVITGSTSWRVPAGVTFAWVNGVAPGGAGQAHSTDGASGGSGAGAGEFCLGLPIPLTPGTFISLDAGTGGVGGNGAVSSTSGTSATFPGFSLLPGGSVAIANGVGHSGAGGGPRGDAGTGIAQDDGAGGLQESPTAFGGASGGAGEGLGVGSAGAGGQQIGQYSAPGTPNTISHPGGGGGCSIYGSGGVGPTTGPGISGSGYGVGSSGMAGDQTTQTTGNGNNGVLMLFYVAP